MNEIEYINNCHSIINNYPIDFNSYPLVKNCRMYTVELLSNQYISIPKLWFHWIITEPNTLALSYKIDYIEFSDIKNDFYLSFTQSKPFIKSINQIDIKYDEFISKSLDTSYRSIISESKDCSPVKKNNAFKYFHEDRLRNIINLSDKYFGYVGNNKISNENILFPYYKNIDYIIDSKYYTKINYDVGLWFSLNKQVDSGLHHDPTFNIIYVLDGKKTIYLFSPDCEPNLYIQEFPLIEKKYIK